MSVIKTGNSAHDAACNLAESTRQAALAGAGVTQASAKTADIVYFRACRASAISNNNGAGIGPFIRGLMENGTGGV